ncbi:ATPase family associated with various cellular activities (AAA), putative [Angomonas deanei]|uniref:ATPase family associated with various cellular activities (AAA), putative n=1 Tax=Angomonas deanei TaxID=59799 RepID=A0A7G2CLZ2_9TRYP|nr:ATPase family associated with various cellular activities (AAA), putative [Angomonas deanei]
MPPKSKSKASPKKKESNKAMVTTDKEEDHYNHSTTLTWEDTNAFSLLETGTFRHRPEVFADLYTPLVEYYVYQLQEGEVAADIRTAQIPFMKATATPRSLTTLFSSLPLLSEEEEKNKPAVKSGVSKAEKEKDEVSNTRKRPRGGSPVPDEEEEDDSWEEKEDIPSPLLHSPPALRQLLEVLEEKALTLLPPITSDSEYLLQIELVYVLRRHLMNIMGFCLDDHFLSEAHHLKVDVTRVFVPLVKALTYWARVVTRRRIAQMHFTPRLLRLAKRMALSPAETRVLTYILICHCGTHIFFVIPNSTLLPSVAFQNHLTAEQLLYMLREDRPYIKEGVLSLNLLSKAMNLQAFNETKVMMPFEVVAALCGTRLSQEQLIKLEKTVLADVLEECAEEDGEKSGSDEDDKETEEKQKRKKRDSTDATLTEEEDLSESADGVVKEVTEHNEKLISEVLDTIGKEAMHTTPGLSIELKDIYPFSIHHSSVEEQHCSKEQVNTPYKNDVEFMEAAFKIIALLINIRNTEGSLKDEEESFAVSKPKMESSVRELKGKVRLYSAVHQARLRATLAAGTFIPRIEQLSRRLKLTELEKLIVLLMVGNTISHDVLIAVNGRYVMRDGQRLMTVGYILFVLCEGLMERVVARKAFYRSSPLIRHSVLSVSIDGRTSFNTDLMDYYCDIDRKIVDSLMGMETETAELVPGSRLYAPTVPLTSVVLPQETTALVHNTIEHYDLVEKCKKKCFPDTGAGVEGGGGLVILFYGPSGTGKTMLANAVAHSLQKKILVVNVTEFKSSSNAPSIMQFLFREAKLNDAIIFFDECESLFETRENNPTVTSLLNAFEKYDGVIVMATNQAQHMDEAMNRRISLMIPFKLPDRKMREVIWRQHLPKALPLQEEVSVERLALEYELSGGLIRNAVMAAIHSAVAREKTDSPTLQQEDFVYGAKLQLRGFFQAAERAGGKSGGGMNNLTPRRPLSSMVLQGSTRRAVRAIAQLTKSRNTLFSQWGFKEELYTHQYQLYLFYGPSGTGKSLAVEGIAYECGTAVRVCNLAELFILSEPGNTISTLFQEARQLGAMILLDEAQVLFNHSDRSRHVAQVLFYHAAAYPRPVIVSATTTAPQHHLDIHAAQLPFTEVIPFHLPDAALRRTLWQKAFPTAVPLDVTPMQFEELSSQYKLNAKEIFAVAFTVCCRAVAELQEGPKQNKNNNNNNENETNAAITMKAIVEEIENVQRKERSQQMGSGMFA